MTAERPYQLLPALSPDEYAALRESIATFGVLQPVVVDEHGAILDGYHRSAIASELDIGYPTVILPGLSEDQKLEQALVLNLARRHLDAEQKRKLVADLRARGLSVRWISEQTGIPRSTVHRFVAAVPSGTPEYVTGKDGKHYRAQAPEPSEGELIDMEARRFASDLRKGGLEDWEIGPLTTEGLDELLRRMSNPPEGNPPLDDLDLRRGLYSLLAEFAARALLRSGQIPRRPAYLPYPGKTSHRTSEYQEAAIWQIEVERKAGGFLNWCDKAGVDLFAKPPTVPDPLDHYILGGLFIWLHWAPQHVEWRDVLTDSQRAKIAGAIV